MTKKTGKLALCGVICGLAVIIMLMSSLFSGMEYALPMVAGAMLLVPMIEFGTQMTVTSYVAIALLSMILPTDKEAALMFVFLFGLYPMVKKYFELIPNRLLEYIAKFAYFNAAAVLAVWLTSVIFGIPVDDGTMGKWAVPLLLALGNFAFIVYDIMLTKLVTLYVMRLQPILHKTFKLK